MMDQQASPVRKYRRVIIDVSVRIFPETQPALSGRAHDISCGGMAFYAPSVLVENSAIKLSFQLPECRVRFGVSAVVRNRNGFRYGVEFQNLTPAEFAEIERVTRILAIKQE